MKKVWPSLACSAVLLSGCMYGSGIAPVTALNSPNQQPTRAPVGQVYVQPGQTVALTRTQVQPRPAQPVTVNTQNVRPQPTQDGMSVSEPSPYAEPAKVQAVRPSDNNDGWSVAPQTADQQQTAQTAPTASEGARPVRPEDNSHPVADEPKVRDTASTEAASEQKPNRPEPQSQESQQQQVASATPPQQPAKTASNETPVSALLKKASASLGKGDLDGAAAYLENAQRIEPQNAKILYDIANIRYHQGRYKDAETFAGRAVQVGGGNDMMKKSWALVANARKSLGDNQGAIAAAEKAASY